MIVMSGDFRQCLPVVPGASRAGTVKTCINRSSLWKHFVVLQLKENMRVLASGDRNLEEFDKWLLNMGDGTAPTAEESDLIEVPENMCTVIDKKDENKSMAQFCEEIFPEMRQNIGNEKWLEGRAILAPTNQQVDMINRHIVDEMPGELITLHSSDALDNDKDAYR